MQPCLVGVRQSVHPDGLAALRLAVAVARDPQSAFLHDQRAYRRSIPQPRGTSRAASQIGAMHREALAGSQGALAPSHGAPEAPPRIPSPSPPAEPTSQQAVIMSAVRRAQQGDGEAFGELYDNYVDLVHRYISHRVGNHALAEDLTSETFLRALRRIGTFTWQGRDFGAWLVTIARNLIADHFKSSRYKLEHYTPDVAEAGGDGKAEGPENEVLAGITNSALLAAVRQLGQEQQECIVLRFLQGLSVAETAAILGKNEGAVKALQYRAVKALGRLLPSDLVA
ncbi:MAG TPA: sigma-70 family RNA polymerase sigma factor [Mycobacteriales bacterium]|nr:sigma-70 family RNA polymerase sigma factor [Mycobacteriales bacterium]